MTADGKPTQILKEEHQRVLEKLGAMKDLLERLEQKKAVTPELRRLASFFQKDFWLHFDKEDLALFPELANYIPRNAGPLQMMFIEHEQLRNINEVFQHALSDYLNDEDSPLTRETIRKAGMNFISSLRSHIDNENGMMFTLANAHLTQDQEDDIMRVFAQIEAGAGKRIQDGTSSRGA